MDDEKMIRTPGFASRVALSILSFFGLVIFVIVWLFFYAGSFGIYQNIAVVIVALLAFCGIMGAAWASWGMKYGSRYCDEKPARRRTRRRRA